MTPDVTNCTLNKIKSSPAPWVGLVSFITKADIQNIFEIKGL